MIAAIIANSDIDPSLAGMRLLLSCRYFDPRASPTSPATVATIPPTSIHIALSVGEPVKNRETSEPNELDALMPKTISKMPPASSARESGLFMFYLFELNCAVPKK